MPDGRTEKLIYRGRFAPTYHCTELHHAFLLVTASGLVLDVGEGPDPAPHLHLHLLVVDLEEARAEKKEKVSKRDKKAVRQCGGGEKRKYNFKEFYFL